jgi:hypothetical protein
VIREGRDPEIQQARLTVRRDEDVAGFQIAMDDEVVMGELHRLAHAEEQTEAIGHGELACAAVLVDADAIDVFHDQIGQPFFGRTAVEQPRDLRVLELGQDLALAAESAEQILVAQWRGDDLDRHLLVELVVGACREIHRAHAAAADLPGDLVRPEAPPGPADGRRRELSGRSREESLAGTIVCIEQRADARPHRRIRRLPGKKGVAFAWRQLECPIEEFAVCRRLRHCTSTVIR